MRKIDEKGVDVIVDFGESRGSGNGIHRITNDHPVGPNYWNKV
jgi:hypothetical protein